MAKRQKPDRIKANQFDLMVKSGASLEEICAAIPKVTCGVKTFFSRWPSLFQYFDQDRASPVQWANFALKWPSYRNWVDFGRFGAKEWIILLSNNPRFVFYAQAHINRLDDMTDVEVKRLLTKQPRLMYYPWFREWLSDQGLDAESIFDASLDEKKAIKLTPYPVWPSKLQTGVPNVPTTPKEQVTLKPGIYRGVAVTVKTRKIIQQPE